MPPPHPWERRAGIGLREQRASLPTVIDSSLLPCLAQLSESPASLPPCPAVETALINQRDLADALLDTERSLRELTQPSGVVDGVLWGQGTQSGTQIRHPPQKNWPLSPQAAPSLRPHLCLSTYSPVSGVGPSPTRPLL